MPLPYHLIDGYNLLHAAGLARATYGPGDLERARYGLLVRVADGLGDDERTRTTVVFDAADPPAEAAGRFRFRDMTVLFAVETGEADPLIEELIRKHPSPRQLRVVSDDVRLQRAAKRRGAQAVKSEAFLGRLSRRAAPRPAADRREMAGSEREQAEDWFGFFGLSGDDLAAEVAAPPPEIEPPTALPTSDAAAAPPKKESGERPKTGRTPEPKAAVPGAREAAAEPPAEDAAFWQRRIDELLAEEASPLPRRPDAS